MAVSGDRRVAKNLFETIVEMTRSVRIINDSLESFARGKDYHSIVIAGQIRALLSEKRSDAYSVLLYLSQILEYQLFIFVDDRVGFDGSFDDASVHLVMGEISAFRRTSRQRKVTLQSFFKEQIVAKYYGNSFTLEQLVKSFANHSGGAHFSKYSPKELQSAPMLHAPGYPAFLNFVIRFAEVLVQIMKLFIKELFELEFHIVLAVPRSPNLPFSICNLSYPGTPMELEILVDSDDKIHISLEGLDSTGIIVDLHVPIDLSNPTYLQFRVRVNDYLTTEVEVVANGKEIARQVIPSLLLMYNEILHQSLFVGSKRAGQGANHSFYFGGCRWMMKQANDEDRAKVVIEMSNVLNNNSYEYHLLDVGSYFQKDVGSYEMKIFGNYKITTKENI